jgi:lipoprotein-anchoring transpeptidase ErfK/SrfK
LIGAAFGSAATVLGGCATLDHDGYGAVPLPPSPQPAMPLAAPVQIETLPAGVSRVPYYGAEARGTIMIDIARHKLYQAQGDGTALAYPIASPRNGADIPPADNIVTRKAVNPPWTPTANMRARHPELPAQVAGGIPENPLGVRALYLGSTLFRIHGTNAPESIGTNASSGCIRMRNEHVVDLYDRTPVGTTVRVYRDTPVPGIAPDASPRPFPGGLY